MAFKVIYLDDEPDLCEIFVDIFASPEIQVVTFSDPATAIAEISKSPPDLLFLDYRLPNTTGDQIALKLNNAVPKVLITGDISVDVKYAFLKIFQKPFKVEEIQTLLDSYLAVRKAA